jgi:hypothetical protein
LALGIAPLLESQTGRRHLISGATIGTSENHHPFTNPRKWCAKGPCAAAQKYAGFGANSRRPLKIEMNCMKCPPGGWRDRQLPDGGPLLLLGAFCIRRFGMLIRILRMLLGLGSVLFTFGMVILAVSFGGSPMGLCSGFVMFRRLVVFIFHVDVSCRPTNFGYPQRRLQ